jgi:hypothetical protein
LIGSPPQSAGGGKTGTIFFFFFFFFVAVSEVVLPRTATVEKPVGALMLVMVFGVTADLVLDTSCDLTDSELDLEKDGREGATLLFEPFAVLHFAVFELLEVLTGTVAKPVEV